MMIPQSRGNVERAVEWIDRFVATYTRGADMLCGSAPRGVNRVFGGLMWVIALATCAGYVSATHVAQHNTSNGGIWNLLLMLVCGGNLVAMTVAAFAQPSCKAKPAPENVPANMAGGAPCPKCSILRPIRSMHCDHRACQACIARYDHHSPWLNACVGAHNQVAYTAHLILWFASAAITAVFALLGLLMTTASLVPRRAITPGGGEPGLGLELGSSDGSAEGGGDPAAAWSLLHTVVLLVCGVLAVYSGLKLRVHLRWVHENLTPHEVNNRRRLTYFRGGIGGFNNPFDGGAQANWAEYLRLGGRDWREPQGYTVMDLEGHPLRQAILGQARGFRDQAAATGQALAPQQQQMVDMCKPYLDADDAKAAAAAAGAGSRTTVGGEPEVKHHAPDATCV